MTPANALPATIVLCLVGTSITCSGGPCGHPRTRPEPSASESLVDPGKPGPPPYPSGKPYTRWWWFPTAITDGDIDTELDWLKANGFGGVELAWVNPVRWWPPEMRGLVNRTPKWRDDDWARLVAHAKKRADQLGLGCDFTFGSGWPFGDAEVTDEEASCSYPDVCDHDVSLFWEGRGRARTVDPLNQQAFGRYAERMLKGLRPALAGSPSGLFCDSWELGIWLWNRDLGAKFQQRFGYDIRPTMDLLDETDNDGRRYDYMALLSDQVIDNFYRPFAARAHMEGAFVRTQAHGSPVDLLAAYATADVPETEAMLYEPAFGQIAASAAALARKQVVSSETFTCAYGFPDTHFGREQTADLKLVADALFANGVNQIVWHGKPFTSSAVPDAMFYATVYLGKDGALAEDLAGFNDYMAKVSKAMRRGRTLSQVAVYLPIEDNWMSFSMQPSTDPDWTIPYRGRLVPHVYPSYDLHYVRMPEAQQGFRPLWVDNWALRQGRVEAGRLQIGDQSFSALYLDVSYLDSGALDTVLSLARAGLPVCLRRPPRQPGWKASDTYAARLDALQRLPNTACEYVDAARGKPLVAGRHIPDFWARRDGDKTIIFFANPRAQGLQLPIRYGQGLTTERIEHIVEITVSGHTLTVPLTFEPNQSLLVTIDDSGRYQLEDIAFQPKSAARGGR
jgi:hypothetical protein